MATIEIEGKIDSGQSAVKPHNFEERYGNIRAVDTAFFSRINVCRERYVSCVELKSVVAALRAVTTESAVLPAQYRNRRCVYFVAIERNIVGTGTIEGPPSFNEVE